MIEKSNIWGLPGYSSLRLHYTSYKVLAGVRNAITCELQTCRYVLNLRARGPRLPQARPSALVLSCRVDRSSEFQSSPQDEVRVSQELSAKEDDVCFAFLQVVVCLFAVENESDGANLDLREGPLDTIGEVNLRTAECSYFALSPPNEQWGEPGTQERLGSLVWDNFHRS